MRVVFLLGSGICVDAGMPSVADITEQVFGGVGVIRHSDATYYIAEDGDPNFAFYREAAEPALAFTRQLRELADSYFAEYIGNRRASYEDVANLGRPPLLPLVRRLRNPGHHLAHDQAARPNLPALRRRREERPHDLQGLRVRLYDRREAPNGATRAAGDSDRLEPRRPRRPHRRRARVPLPERPTDEIRGNEPSAALEFTPSLPDLYGSGTAAGRRLATRV